jgi:chromosome segregation ATPase
MSEIITYQRQIADVTKDIYVQTGQFLRTAIEIGRLLFEAKALVAPGGWSKYIEEELPFSHSWANNYMKLYKEFGSDQTSLFGDSQTFMNLRPTQALELLALPAEDREEFVQNHNVEDMSTRQLRQAVQDQLEEERRRHEETRSELESAEARARDAEHSLIDMQQQLAAAKSSEDAWQEELDKLKQDKKRAEESEANALRLLKQKQEELGAAKAMEKAAQDDLQKAFENPNIPESMMEQLRKEAEAAAAKQSTEEAQKKVSDAEAAMQEAIRAKEAAEAGAREVQEKLAEAQRKLKMADPAVMEYDTLSQKLMADYNVLDGLRRKITVSDKEVGAKLLQFQKKMVAMMSASLGGA